MKLKRLFHVVLLMAVAATGFAGFSRAATASEAAVLERPAFQLPVPCGQRWTTSTHSGHASQYMIDMVSAGGTTRGTPALASAGGTVSTSSFFSDAGNMVVINHADGWQTRYLHLDRRDVSVGDTVVQGQQIGTVGNTGANTTGAHLHYEQKLNGSVQQAVISGNLVPVVWSYNQHFETSANCNGNPPPPTKQWVDTFADAPGYSSPGVGTSTGKLYKGTNYVYCRKLGPKVQVGDAYNHWWLKTDLDVGPANQWVSAYYLSRWGNDEAKDNNGVDIKDCAE